MTHYGLDVGRFTDRTALVGLDGDVVTEAHLMSGLEFSTQASILEPLIYKDSLCLVDVTGLGIGLFERLADMELPVVATTIGPSMSPPKVITDWRAKNPGRLPPISQRSRVYVGKTHLMGRMLGVVNARALTVAPSCGYRTDIRRELGELTLSYTKRGGISIQNRKGHDDLALGLALAILARDLSSRLLRSVGHASEAKAA